MRAIHWIRSRQEGRELAYWLSFVFFDSKDRSWNNRLYLIYLVLFFGIWWFMALVWFAEAGAFLLTTLSPSNPISLAVALELISLLLWFVVSFIQAARRSPVTFSEEDAFLICQMPLDPRQIVLRWLPMPWVKSLLPFALVALVLGFSVAEATLPSGGTTGQDLLEYARVGSRALLVLAPFHLTVLTLNWAMGIWFMKRQRQVKALVLPLAYFLLGMLSFVSGILAPFGVGLPALAMVTGGLRVGFGWETLGPVLLSSGLTAVVSVLILFFVSTHFSPSLAAQETKEQATLQNLRRYGFVNQAKEIHDQSRLHLDRKSIWLPAWQGGAAMLWKDVLQYCRTLDVSSIFDLLFFVGSAVGLVYLPNLSGRILLIVTWALQASKFSTHRLRQDLTRWITLKQLPVKPQEWILYDLAFACGAILLMSVIGLAAGSALAGRSALGEVLALPGMIASIAGVAAQDIFRNSRTNLLMSGQAPDVSEVGVIIGALCAGIPVLIYGGVPGLAGILIAFLASVLMGWLALSAAVKAYRSIR